MRILRVAVGNKEEAYIENSFKDGVNIICSNENNKGKTILVQAVMYSIGNKPIFPNSFQYQDYYYYLEFECDNKEFHLLRCGDSYLLKINNGMLIFDGESDLKRYWTENIFKLPVIPFKGKDHIVDMELFVQLFFVGQDGKDTSTIFNAGYYHKDDFKSMILSYADPFSIVISQNDIQGIKNELSQLRAKKQEKIELCDFYNEVAPATEYLSSIKDKKEFNRKISEMDAITDKITDIRKKRSRFASRKSLWNGTLKELKSLNHTIEVGELRCMNCNSTNIAFRGTGKAKYNFDVSTPEMRSQIVESIQSKIESLTEEIEHYDYEIAKLQEELSEIMNDEEVTLENVLAYKTGFNNIEEIETAIKKIDIRINELSEKLKISVNKSSSAKKNRDAFYKRIIDEMNRMRIQMDSESSNNYSDIFTKRGSTVSGSEETIYYASRILALNSMLEHECPLIIDSFRAEDLSTDKENELLKLFKKTDKQCILTTTLKKEEEGKYLNNPDLNVIDYSSHISNKLLDPSYLNSFFDILKDFGIVL